MQIPLVNLKAQAQEIKSEVMSGFEKIVDTCNFVLGAEVKQFEDEFAAFSGAKFCVGLANGTEALHLAAAAVGLKEGDEVVLPANTFIATALGAHYQKTKIKLVDVEEDTFLPKPDAFLNAYDKGVKAFMPVHLFGRSLDLSQLMAFAKDKDLFVIEDAAQAHGAECSGATVGSVGDIACFSFYPGKNLGAFGDAGAITTNSKELRDKVESLRNYGSPKKYHHPEIGYNCRLDTLQAVVLQAKLKRLATWNQKRREAAKKYDECLKGIGDLILPAMPDNINEHVFHLYVVRTNFRDKLLEFLNKEGIGAGIHYPMPIHLHGAFEYLEYRKGDFPVAEKLADTIVSLPLFPEITDAEIMYVKDKIKAFFSKHV